MIINDELYNKWLSDEYVVATRTKEEYDQFMRWLEENTDLKWLGEINPTGAILGNETVEEILIDVGFSIKDRLGYSSEQFYLVRGYKIIEFKELFTKEPFTQDLRELLKVGYMVGYKHGEKILYEVLNEWWYKEHLTSYGSDLRENYNKAEIVSISRPKYNGVKEMEWKLVWERKEELKQYLDLSVEDISFSETYVVFKNDKYYIGVNTEQSNKEKQISEELYELLKKELEKDGGYNE